MTQHEPEQCACGWQLATCPPCGDLRCGRCDPDFGNCLADTACHCGRPVHVYDEPGMEGFTRGLCLECSTVRCDVAPGTCATASSLPWGFPYFDGPRMLRLVRRMRRIPAVRLAYRQIKNGHRGGPVAIKPALRGRRHGW